jgi:hypothetical protein
MKKKMEKKRSKGEPGIPLKIARFLGILDPTAASPRLSAKFEVFIMATIALWAGKLHEWGWVSIAGIFMGARVADAVTDKIWPQKNGNSKVIPEGEGDA